MVVARLVLESLEATVSPGRPTVETGTTAAATVNLLLHDRRSAVVERTMILGSAVRKEMYHEIEKE